MLILFHHSQTSHHHAVELSALVKKHILKKTLYYQLKEFKWDHIHFFYVTGCAF